MNCSIVVFWEKDGSLPTAASTIPTLGARYTGHSIRKCTSSSTLPGQNGQKRCPLGVFGTVCLPFSMFRTLLESLNFVSDCLNAAFFISCRYFSHPESLSNALSRHATLFFFRAAISRGDHFVAEGMLGRGTARGGRRPQPTMEDP